MRIAQVAPLIESVPPQLYGGTERVVAWLTEELVALGHDVTLFASGDSKTSATLVSIIPRGIRLSKPRPDPFPAYAAQLAAVADAAATFDIIHCHIDWIHLPLLKRLGVPHLTTIHNRLDTPDLPAILARFSEVPLVSISDHHRKPVPGANWLGTVHHGMPATSPAAILRS
jgi:glycosyltransferase involved in cell wall biosynthesis